MLFENFVRPVKRGTFQRLSSRMNHQTIKLRLTLFGVVKMSNDAKWLVARWSLLRSQCVTGLPNIV